MLLANVSHGDGNITPHISLPRDTLARASSHQTIKPRQEVMLFVPSKAKQSNNILNLACSKPIEPYLLAPKLVMSELVMSELLSTSYLETAVFR